MLLGGSDCRERPRESCVVGVFQMEKISRYLTSQKVEIRRMLRGVERPFAYDTMIRVSRARQTKSAGTLVVAGLALMRHGGVASLNRSEAKRCYH